jgi:hypothetical protein
MLMIRVFQIALLSSLAFWTAGCNSTEEKPIWKQVKIGEDYDGSDGWKNNWQDYTPGTYSLTTKATDNIGATTTLPVAKITVTDLPPN